MIMHENHHRESEQRGFALVAALVTVVLLSGLIYFYSMTAVAVVEVNDARRNLERIHTFAWCCLAPSASNGAIICHSMPASSRSTRDGVLDHCR
jgi:hypothetical protein